MNKKNLVIALFMLVIGMFFGVAGYALATSGTSPVTMISKIWNGGGLGQSPVNPVSPASPLDPENDRLDTDSTPIHDELPKANDEAKNAEELNQAIISDYKLNVGTFFSAWKSKDMSAFRAKLEKAYSGGIYEKHAQRAEKYITQGVGLNVVDIVFDKIEIESASPNAATLNASYYYQAQDYMVGEEQPIGEVYEHDVKVKVNMVKIGSHWYITGESPIEIED